MPSLASSRVYEHDVPDELEILFLPGAYKNYLNLIDEAHGSFLWNIVSQYKRPLKIQGQYSTKNGKQRLFGARELQVI